MYFLAALTLASAALAVPFQHFRRGTGSPSLPSFPTVPGTAPTGAPTAVADVTSVYHPSITYATTATPSLANALTLSSFYTYPTGLPETNLAAKPVATSSTAKEIDTPHPFPTFPGGTVPGSYPTGSPSGLPLHHLHHPLSQYSKGVSYTRTTPLAAPTPFWGA